MRKALFRVLTLSVTVLLLACGFAIYAFADSRTVVSEVVATSDLEECAVLYARMKRQSFTVTEGEGVYFNQNWTTWWEKYDEENKKWVNYGERLTPGKYRVQAQIRIDGEKAKSYVLSKNVTCTVDGVSWDVDMVTVDYSYSCAFVTSPELVIADDPSVLPPVDIEDAYFSFSGYKEGGKFSEATLAPYLGSESAVEIVGEPVFVEFADNNNDGIPDAYDPEVGFIYADDAIKNDTLYIMLLILRAKAGYDIYNLKASGIHLSAHEIEDFEFLCSYDEENEVLNAIIFLAPCSPSVTFTEEPKDVKGYYRNSIGESLEVSWQASPEASKYQIYKWDDECGWDVMPYTDVSEPSYSFEYDNGSTAGIYRIEAIIDGETVGVSREFELSWSEMQTVSLPIRIDASDSVGASTPPDLTKYYPESDKLTFLSDPELLLNTWFDTETEMPVTSFEDGKKYSYNILAVANEGYCFEITKAPIIGDEISAPSAIRVYGIGWDSVEGESYGVYEVFASFTFTYDESVGIPKERDNILAELVFDAEDLVGMSTPCKIPDAIFAHEALVRCGIDCDCNETPDAVKQFLDIWQSVGEEEPAESFESGKAYTYSLYFHVKEGFEPFGTAAEFDFVLSGAALDVLNVIYSPDIRMLGVRLGFVCDESGAIKAGEHTCQKSKVESASPTCTEAGVIEHFACSCGRAYSDRWGINEISNPSVECVIPATGHSFGEEWRFGGGYHWKECACGDRTDNALHTDSDKSGKCDVCEASADGASPSDPNHVHSYSSDWQSDSEWHFKACSCGEKAMQGAHTDTNENGSCDICGFVMHSSLKKGLGAGAIVGIVLGSVAAAGIGGFSLIWFVIKKKSFAELVKIFKKH